MSGAIWGVVDFSKENITTHYTFEDYKKVYQADYYRQLEGPGYSLFSATFNPKKHSVDDCALIYDDENKLILVADALLDNTAEIRSILDLDARIDYTDTEILLKLYIQKGHECVKYLRGDFAFVLVDLKKQEIFTVRDQMGQRTMYYAYVNGVFYFGTLLKPIVRNMKQNKLDVRWMQDFISINGVLHQITAPNTIYQDVFFLEPAYSALISKEQLRKKQYWSPFKPINNKICSEEAYEHVRKMVINAVEDRIAVEGTVSIMLSGGLDSTAIACVAAELAKESNQVINTFTSVPKFKVDVENPILVTDESEYVQEIAAHYPNINSNILDFDGYNAVNVANELIEKLEIPFKFISNAHWYYPITKYTRDLGSRVLLIGAYGNASFSSGEPFDTMIESFISGDLDHAFKMLRFLLSKTKSKKKFYKRFIRAFVPNKINEHIYLSRVDDEYKTMNKLVDKQALIDNHYFQRIFALGATRYGRGRSRKKRCSLVNSACALNHISEVEVKMGLARGIIIRDPMRDIRLVEYAWQLPSRLFADKEKGRLIARKSMEGIVPDKVRMNFDKRGLQGVDWHLRLDGLDKSLIDFVSRVVIDNQISKIIGLDCDQYMIMIRELVQDYQNQDTLMAFLTLYNLSIYIEAEGGETYEKRMA